MKREFNEKDFIVYQGTCGCRTFICRTCGKCEDCCDCVVCDGCGKVFDYMSVCSNCEQCPDCCKCVMCDGCSDMYAEEDICENCRKCVDCCKCNDGGKFKDYTVEEVEDSLEVNDEEPTVYYKNEEGPEDDE